MEQSHIHVVICHRNLLVSQVISRTKLHGSGNKRTQGLTKTERKEESGYSLRRSKRWCRDAAAWQ